MTIDAVRVVVLEPQDWRAFKAIRLEALRSEPAAFSSTYAESRARPDESWPQRLADPRGMVLAAMAGRRPIGMVGAHRGSDEGDESVAVVFGMYVNEAHRGQGVGRLLLSTLLDMVAAHPEIDTIRLWVGAGQEPARRLYTSIGFRVVGRETHLPQNDRQSHDELIMERPIERSGLGE